MTMLVICAVLMVTWVDPPQSGHAQPVPASQPASRPATQPAATAPVTRNPQQANVLKNLLRETSRPPVILPQADPSKPSASKKEDTLMADGTTLKDCRGRLVRNGEHLEWSYTDENGQALQLEILPNAWLEYMEREFEQGAAQFIVKGEVTRYRGRNFLLLWNYRRLVTNGNLSP